MASSLEEFGTFFRGVGRRMSSVIVNLAIGDRAPLSDAPCLLRITVPMQDAAAHGMGSSSERQVLNQLDRKLVVALSEQCAANFVGRGLTKGQMKFYFYAPAGCEPDSVIAEVIGQHPGYRYRLTRTRDPEWSVYFDELYPNRAEFQMLTTHERQAAAAEMGDSLEIPRPICHWTYFPTAESREQFLHQVRDRGFHVHLLENHEATGNDFRYCVELARKDRADHPHLDELILWLFVRAEECGGYYDSFEAESVANLTFGLSTTG
ncbi:MAG: hypothetical protein JWN70_2178 [Planctomycetaceae bacterium]|nr:hypothetical protein [Planctomycetaceae bacterium]